MWLNWSVATINATLQFLDIYIHIYIYIYIYRLVDFLWAYIIKLLLLYENILLKNYPSNTWFE